MPGEPQIQWGMILWQGFHKRTLRVYSREFEEIPPFEQTRGKTTCHRRILDPICYIALCMSMLQTTGGASEPFTSRPSLWRWRTVVFVAVENRQLTAHNNNQAHTCTLPGTSGIWYALPYRIIPHTTGTYVPTVPVTSSTCFVCC